MKINPILAAAGFAACAALRAAPLASPTAVQTQPDPASPVIVVLKAGTEEPAASDKAGPVPAGWIAIELPGPFEGYVKNKDLNKELDVVAGASVRLAPKDDAGVLTIFQKGDKADITGLHGGWTQVKVSKVIVGYIHLGGPVSAEPVTEPAPAATAPAAPAPATAPASPPGQTLTPVPVAAGEPAAAVQLYEGTLASTRKVLSPHRPFDWQISDADGNRIAYLDLSKLLLTDQIENYAGRPVAVLGSLKPVAGTRDLVIEVQALHLK